MAPSGAIAQASVSNLGSGVNLGASQAVALQTVTNTGQVTNAGAITERWAVQFTNTTAFQVIGEHVGVIATGTTANDLAPINPATAKPYFTLRALGWGSGWAAGNVLRFNTVGALFPVWIVRTIQQGPESAINDTSAGTAEIIRGT